MKPTNYILLLSTFICTLFGCSEEFTPSIQETSREAVLIAELEIAAEFVELSVSSTFSNTEEAYFPNDDELTSDNRPRLSNLKPDGQKGIALRYQSNQHKEKTPTWISASFIFKEGDEISLSANLEVVNMQNIYATTRAPYAGTFEETSGTAEIDSKGDYRFTVRLSDLVDDEDYYHLVPYTASSSTAANKNHLDLSVSTAGNALLFKPAHMDGILIDIDRTDAAKEFSITIPASEIISNNPSHIYLKLKTVTKEYFDYHKSLSFQLESQQGPFDAPIPTVSNVERGQGLFTAYATRMDSIAVN